MRRGRFWPRVESAVESPESSGRNDLNEDTRWTLARSRSGELVGSAMCTARSHGVLVTADGGKRPGAARLFDRDSL